MIFLYQTCATGMKALPCHIYCSAGTQAFHPRCACLAFQCHPNHGRRLTATPAVASAPRRRAVLLNRTVHCSNIYKHRHGAIRFILVVRMPTQRQYTAAPPHAPSHILLIITCVIMCIKWSLSVLLLLLLLLLS